MLNSLLRIAIGEIFMHRHSNPDTKALKLINFMKTQNIKQRSDFKTQTDYFIYLSKPENLWATLGILEFSRSNHSQASSFTGRLFNPDKTYLLSVLIQMKDENDKSLLDYLDNDTRSAVLNYQNRLSEEVQDSEALITQCLQGLKI